MVGSCLSKMHYLAQSLHKQSLLGTKKVLCFKKNIEGLVPY